MGLQGSLVSNKSLIIIITLFILMTYSYIGLSQSLKYIEGYRIKPTIGIRFRPVITTPYYIGIMGGLSIQHPKKRLGMNLRMNYFIPTKKVVDSTSITTPFYNYYLEFIYRLFYFKKKPFRIGFGIGKPSFQINPFYGCPYCFLDEMNLSIQQQILKIDFELRFTFPIGTYSMGWFLPRSDLVFVHLGINYTFDLKRKNNIKI